MCVCVCVSVFVRVSVPLCVGVVYSTYLSLTQEQLKAASDHSSIYLLSEMSGHLRELLSHWFSPSLLDMEQLTWESPCDIMERVRVESN